MTSSEELAKMFNRFILAMLFLCAVLAVSPCAIFAAEPFVVADFENVMANWFGGGGGGAVNGAVEETKDAHDGKKAMYVTLPRGTVGWAMAQSRPRGAEYSKLGDMGYEAINFWVKGIEGIDQTQVLLHLTGAGDHSVDNRWDYRFIAPLDEWTFMSVPFEDMTPWNQEKRPFDLANLDYFGFFRAAIPWPDFEFIVDQMEFGPITQVKPEFVEPSEKLSTTWGRIRGF